MRRFIKGGNRRRDAENAIGSPAGVEMKDYAEDDELDKLVYNAAPSDGSRVVSPTPNVPATGGTPESQGDVSAGSNFNVQETLDRASHTPASTGPGTPSRLGTMIDEIYKTPQLQQQQQQQVPASAASSAGPTAQFKDIDFSPDFNNMGKDPETFSEKSSDVGDYKETFGDQIDILDDLLTTPGKVLGDLADTLISPDDDDSVDKELEDLEGNSRMLSQELSQVGWYTTGVVREDSTPKNLFPNTPEIKRTGTTDSDYDHLFSPSPDPKSKTSTTPKTMETPQKIPSTPDDGTPSSKKQRQDDSNSSFLIPSMFGFRRTPVKGDEQLGIDRNPIAKGDLASEASQSAVSSTPSATSSMFQSFASMVGVTSPAVKNESQEILTSQPLSPNDKSQGQESSTSQPSLVGEKLLMDVGSPPQDTPTKQLSTNLETVSPIRRDPPITTMPPLRPPASSSSSYGQNQVIDDFDANTDSMQQPLINQQQQQHILPRTPDRQKRDDDLKVQTSHPGLPSPGGLMSPPAIYADDTTTDEEEAMFYVPEVNKTTDYSVVSSLHTDHDVTANVKKEEPEDNLTTRQIACLCGFMVFIAICALLIALFATDMLSDMDDAPEPSETPDGPIIIDVPTINANPTRLPTRRPTPFPTPLEPRFQFFDVDYNIRVADGEANSTAPSSYTPDLIESMDRLSVGVLDVIEQGKETSSLYERRRLSSLVLPSAIVSIDEEECPTPNGRDRCERIVAGISLSDDSNIADAFRNTLQQEVSSGGLQFFLLQVNPDSPILVLDSAQVPGLTPAPSVSSLMPATTPSLGPGDPEPTMPTTSPVLQPTPGAPGQTPTPAPQPSPGLPTIDQPSPGPPTIDPPTPGPTIPGLPTINRPSPGPTLNPAPRPSPEPQTPTAPLGLPTPNPTPQPSPFPTRKPTLLPTGRPTSTPTDRRTRSPTLTPTAAPIFKSTPVPTLSSTKTPTLAPNPPISNPTLFDLVVSKSFDGGAAIRDSATPQHNAFIWLLTNKDLDNYEEERLLQRYVMATLYFSTDGESWLNNNGWLSDEDECDWFSKAGTGACNRGKLENLELDYNNLNGFLPEELGLLSNSLQRMVLHGGPNENLDGSIPTTIGYLTNLRLLFMPNNSIEGVLPSEIGNLTLLQQINLSRSRLQGSLPSTIRRLTSLTTFDVSGNEFTGELPGDIGKMEKLNKLLLQNNRFVGPIPSEIGQIRRLQRLEAYGNSFDSIPSEIGNLAFCETIEIQDNSIQGPIPTEIGELRRLRLLDLGNNRLTGNIPTEFGKLGELKLRLRLASNQLRGSIPTELGKLDKLRIIDLRENRLSGNIPEDLSKMKKISTIHLDGNNLEGVIPDKVCSLFDRTFPEFSADCSEFDDDCPCCTTCCVENQCSCRYEGTPQEYLCYSRTAGSEP